MVWKLFKAISASMASAVLFLSIIYLIFGPLALLSAKKMFYFLK